MTARNLIDPARVKRWFDRAALNERRHAGVAEIIDEIRQRLFERLAYIRLQPASIVDAGCAQGAAYPLLQSRYPKAHICGIDFSTQQIDRAQQQWAQPRNGWQAIQGQWQQWLAGKRPIPRHGEFLCADMQHLPQSAQSTDLLWSHAALQWVDNPPAVFAEWQRILRVDGLLMFSSFGPDTLIELRQALARVWPAASPRTQTLSFVDMHDLGDMLVNAGFATPVVDMEKITLTYGSPVDLLADVRLFGPNPLHTRARGLLGRRSYQQLLQALETQRGADGRLSLTLEVIYGHAWKAAPKTIADGRAVVTFRPRAAG
ncbi:methyltransferase domain-containing protein [Parvibium lacunae]|uniref:Malonyl-[acyl-carrier protein] O-methyltransferase n=1 Tax=Parvibium lacunae TaxID=1888893 RepID=A0A368KZ66_9BURK|nr:methyltransferase domain-containing protein [Parvibium lacunae]RCS56665.1 methyltransferase domain-containing protein [Parvibium lacunae]